jgi:hypothetical protein
MTVLVTQVWCTFGKVMTTAYTIRTFCLFRLKKQKKASRKCRIGMKFGEVVQRDARQDVCLHPPRVRTGTSHDGSLVNLRSSRNGIKAVHILNQWE